MMKKKVLKLFKYVPEDLKGIFLRQLLTVPDNFDEDIIFQLAQNENERIGAFSLVYECYLETGSETPNKSKVRINPFLALPSTQIIIAKHKDQIIGTLSIIPNSSFGLPSNERMDYEELIKKDFKIAELSSLAVKKNYRGNKGNIFFGLIKYAIELNSKHLNIDYIVTMIRKNKIDLYLHLMGFNYLIKDEIKGYKYSNFANVYCLYLDINMFPLWLYKHYGLKMRNKNLYNFFYKTNLKNFILPNSPYKIPNINRLTSKEINLLKITWKKKIKLLSKHQLIYLDYIYPDFSSKSFFSKNRKLNRAEVRFELLHNGLIIDKNKSYKVSIKNISPSGLKIFSENMIETNKNYILKVNLGDFDSSKLVISAVRKEADKNIYGLKILRSDNNWKNYFNFINQDAA
ncbi:MAG: hypothetical protein KDD58_07480 [Bdellovibrionales bacterium]|nr:hypothetical protein [Bdellovibrionales bacterium]